MPIKVINKSHSLETLKNNGHIKYDKITTKAYLYDSNNQFLGSVHFKTYLQIKKMDCIIVINENIVTMKKEQNKVFFTKSREKVFLVKKSDSGKDIDIEYALMNESFFIISDFYKSEKELLNKFKHLII